MIKCIYTEMTSFYAALQLNNIQQIK